MVWDYLHRSWCARAFTFTHSSSPRLDSHATTKHWRFYGDDYKPFAPLCATAHAQSSGHVMPVMAASMARGGANGGFLLRVAWGTWWSRPGGCWGSWKTAAPATARKFRATGT